jgi:hypothetical protein
VSVAVSRTVAAATNPPKTMAKALASGKALKVANHAWRGDFAQRVKSGVMVPLSMNRLTTRVTAAPRVSPAASRFDGSPPKPTIDDRLLSCSASTMA